MSGKTGRKSVHPGERFLPAFPLVPCVLTVPTQALPRCAVRELALPRVPLSSGVLRGLHARRRSLRHGTRCPRHAEARRSPAVTHRFTGQASCDCRSARPRCSAEHDRITPIDPCADVRRPERDAPFTLRADASDGAAVSCLLHGASGERRPAGHCRASPRMPRPPLPRMERGPSTSALEHSSCGDSRPPRLRPWARARRARGSPRAPVRARASARAPAPPRRSS
jgi:hypothetical protein